MSPLSPTQVSRLHHPQCRRSPAGSNSVPQARTPKSPRSSQAQNLRKRRRPQRRSKPSSTSSSERASMSAIFHSSRFQYILRRMREARSLDEMLSWWQIGLDLLEAEQEKAYPSHPSKEH